MSLIDLILNLAGLLLWLNWRSQSRALTIQPYSVSLLSTLKKAEITPPTRGFPLIGLVALLMVRSIFYWTLGSAANWRACLSLGAITLTFRSDYLGRMFLFSGLSFAQMLGTYYLWLLLLSMLNRTGSESDPILKLVRQQLGRVSRWPRVIQFVLPWVIGGGLWMWCHPVLVWMGLVQEAPTWGHLAEQSAVLGLCVYLAWKFLLVALLLLHLLNSYVYLGNHPFWLFVNNSARQLLWPLAWLPLRFGRVDFTPLAGIALVFFAGEFGPRGLTLLYQRFAF